jgi:hypothetical protein
MKEGGLAERIARSAGVFLVGLAVACAVEIAVDWNATLYEINVLRAQLQQKGENYADILRKASEGALAAYDWDALERLSAQLFDDPEVVYVRFTDRVGNTLHDRLRPEYGRAFAAAHGGEGFRAHYRHAMDRDARGLLADPIGLRRRMAGSRHRDFIQIFTDAENQLLRRFVAPTADTGEPPRTLYQDRLADAGGRLDRGLTYALGAVTADEDEPFGVVLIAFANDRLNAAVRAKLWKGLGITVFFVGLILVQNVLARRAKLRLQALEAALAAARGAIRSAQPRPPALAWADLGIAAAQAERVGGTVYDLAPRVDGGLDVLIAVPEGNGVDAAFASVVLRDQYRLMAVQALAPEALLPALLAAYDASPLARRLELMLLRLLPDGEVQGLVAGLTPPRQLADGGARALEPAAPLDVAPLRQLAAPPRPFHGRLQDGPLLVFDDGLPRDAPRRFSPDDAAAHAAPALASGAQAAAEAVVAAAVRRYKKSQTDDLLALVVSRRSPEETHAT